MPRKLKTPKDYPRFDVRLPDAETKKSLDTEIEAALKHWNRLVEEDERKYTKAEVVAAALLKGLRLIQSNRLKPPF